jgi:hypothetical protein
MSGTTPPLSHIPSRLRLGEIYIFTFSKNSVSRMIFYVTRLLLSKFTIGIIIIIMHLSWSWPHVDPFRSHLYRSPFIGLPWFLLPFGV